jgi:hypothetical protein
MTFLSSDDDKQNKKTEKEGDIPIASIARRASRHHLRNARYQDRL